MTSEHYNDYQKALELAESGNYEQAWSYLQNYLQKEPQDVQALNDAGAILHCLGRSDSAINYLVRANELKNDCQQVVWNLMEAYLAAGKPECAEQLFAQAEQMKILNPDVVNRTAQQYLDKGDKGGFIEVLLNSLRLWPEQEILENMITVVKSKRPKIAFICGGDGKMFLNPILDYIGKRFEVRVFEGQTEQELYELMKWSDISWFEWCTNLAVLGSRFDKVCKMIIRLHRYEAYQDWPMQVNWQNIDYLITVGNSYVKQALFAQVPQIQEMTSVVTIANGVELEKIRFIERSRGKNLAFVGYINL
ncbi:MAG: tetratricopeptide repeat protein, partial [Phycisphaerae bacterium]